MSGGEAAGESIMAEAKAMGQVQNVSFLHPFYIVPGGNPCYNRGVNSGKADAATLDGVAFPLRDRKNALAGEWNITLVRTERRRRRIMHGQV